MGVLLQVVRVDVVFVVRIDPPAPADSEHQVQHQPELVVPRRAGEDLPVTRIVAQEADLRERHREQHRVRQLHPEVIDQEDHRHARRQDGQANHRVHRVVNRLLVQQSGRDDTALQFSVVAFLLRVVDIASIFDAGGGFRCERIAAW
jgi:hypothetical protein